MPLPTTFPPTPDMAWSNHVQGPQFAFPIFENALVKVEPMGDHVSVGIKDSEGRLFSWWEPRHPFLMDTVPLPLQDGWTLTEEPVDADEIRMIFEKNGERYVLGLRVTDPTAAPEPVTVTWER